MVNENPQISFLVCNLLSETQFHINNQYQVIFIKYICQLKRETFASEHTTDRDVLVPLSSELVCVKLQW